jgi:hypothetical protein
MPAAHGRDGVDIGTVGAALDLDGSDDLGHAYLAQTIFSTASTTEPGGMSNHCPRPICG